MDSKKDNPGTKEQHSKKVQAYVGQIIEMAVARGKHETGKQPLLKERSGAFNSSRKTKASDN